MPPTVSSLNISWTFSDFFGRNLQTIQTLNQKSNLKHKEKPHTKNGNNFLLVFQVEKHYKYFDNPVFRYRIKH